MSLFHCYCHHLSCQTVVYFAQMETEVLFTSRLLLEGGRQLLGTLPSSPNTAHSLECRWRKLVIASCAEFLS